MEDIVSQHKYFCGCGEPIYKTWSEEQPDKVDWYHLRRRLDKHHPASLQLPLPLEDHA